MGRSVQGHRQPPRVGFDSTGEGTIHPIHHHTRDGLSAEQRRSQAGPHAGFASDILSIGGPIRVWCLLVSYGFHMLIIHCSLARRFRPPAQNMHGQRRIGGRLASSVAEAARSRLTTRRVAAPRRLPVCPCEHATGAQWDGVLDWRAADRRPMRWPRHGGGVMHRPLVQHEEGAGRRKGRGKMRDPALAGTRVEPREFEQDAVAGGRFDSPRAGDIVALGGDGRDGLHAAGRHGLPDHGPHAHAPGLLGPHFAWGAWRARRVLRVEQGGAGRVQLGHGCRSFFLGWQSELE